MQRSKFIILALVLSGCTEAGLPTAARFSSRAPRLSLTAAAPEAVLPSGYATVMGETNNSFPHTQKNLRYQQVFLGSDVTNPTLVGVCLRRDDVNGGISSTQTLSIKLGPTSLDYTNLSRDFYANYSASPTEVFSGEVVVPANSGLGTAADFDFC